MNRDDAAIVAEVRRILDQQLPLHLTLALVKRVLYPPQPPPRADRGYPEIN